MPRIPYPSPPAWSSGIFTVGVTGTNGKTTTTALVAAALGRLHAPVLRNTTVGSFLGSEPLELAPDFDGFMEGMERLRSSGGRLAAIELTSEALACGFAKAWPCSIGVFTNLTREHLDAHGSAEHYLASKAQLFVHLPASGCAVLNGCDPSAELLEAVVPKGVRVLRYGVGSVAPGRALDLVIDGIRLSWQGTAFRLQGGLLPDSLELSVRAIGEVHAENAAAALAAAVAAGVDVAQAADAISRVPAPPGRFEVLGVGPRVVVDYAHTPDALLRTLQSARLLCEGRLHVVFGAGGNRDQGKRPEMGEAARGADRVTLTSDNPRSEAPAQIAAQIRAGLGAHADVRIELDRARAIREAVQEAAEGDVVVVAGKGHERVQLIGAERRPFCDQQVAQEALAMGSGGESNQEAGAVIST
jgi:UDP-N-acetylmuramoyl-L-alanyl-D-glutamate--2,6-diaminopimelate ligase